MTALITDIDGTLTGNEQGLRELNDYLSQNRKDFYLVYATGRCLEEYREVIGRGILLEPEAAIINTGADILEGSGLDPVPGWHEAINDERWNAQKVIDVLSGTDGIRNQAHLSEFKVSYFTDPALSREAEKSVALALKKAGIRAKVIISHRKFIDVLPEKCDKGKAAEYLIRRAGIDFKDVIAAGDSENDLDLFNKFRRGIVVSNAHDEVKARLKGRDLFFASCDCAAGILEGLRYYL